ncbi:hypothetical protein V499_07483 [Pseudogymnoascus sp. VKM F-103]|nr:hypothetical protein V499_07483 [Pseudogymnoascus sp. VKM F-103]
MSYNGNIFKEKPTPNPPPCITTKPDSPCKLPRKRLHIPPLSPPTAAGRGASTVVPGEDRLAPLPLLLLLRSGGGGGGGAVIEDGKRNGYRPSHPLFNISPGTSAQTKSSSKARLIQYRPPPA